MHVRLIDASKEYDSYLNHLDEYKETVQEWYKGITSRANSSKCDKGAGSIYFKISDDGQTLIQVSEEEFYDKK